MRVGVKQAAAVADRLRQLSVVATEFILTPADPPEQKVLVGQVALALPPQVVSLGRCDLVLRGVNCGGLREVRPVAGFEADFKARIQGGVFSVARCRQVALRRFTRPGALWLVLCHNGKRCQQCGNHDNRAQIHA